MSSVFPLTALLAALAACSVSCHSMPILPRLSPEQERILTAPPLGRLSASLVGCASPLPELDVVCEHQLGELRTLLVATGLFTSLEDDPSRADLALTLVQSPGRPYWTAPPHNPAALLLSIAIPFWWTDSFGEQLLVEQRLSARTARIDMRREGTRVMWVLAPLFNLSPDRAFTPDLNREASHLKLHLLEFLRPPPVD